MHYNIKFHLKLDAKKYTSLEYLEKHMYKYGKRNANFIFFLSCNVSNFHADVVKTFHFCTRHHTIFKHGREVQ